MQSLPLHLNLSALHSSRMVLLKLLKLLKLLTHPLRIASVPRLVVLQLLLPYHPSLSISTCLLCRTTSRPNDLTLNAATLAIRFSKPKIKHRFSSSATYTLSYLI